MCVDPITLTVASAAIGATGNLMTGFTRMSEANANAAALEASAQQREEKAKYDIEQADRRYQRTEGAVRAKIGASGVDMQSFSDVLADDAKESALEKKAIKVGADVEANNLRFQAQGQKASGTASMVSGIFGAAGSVIGAGSDYNKQQILSTRYAKLGGVSIDNTFDAGN